jgi:hypothetical protein
MVGSNADRARERYKVRQTPIIRTPRDRKPSPLAGILCRESFTCQTFCCIHPGVSIDLPYLSVLATPAAPIFSLTGGTSGEGRICESRGKAGMIPTYVRTYVHPYRHPHTRTIRNLSVELINDPSCCRERLKMGPWSLYHVKTPWEWNQVCCLVLQVPRRFPKHI